ncbi:MAG: hypothetical protein AB1782_01335 [Cyanobacteriota bacterium]
METVQILDFKLIYVWALLDKLLENPLDQITKDKFTSLMNNTTLLEKQCFDSACYLWSQSLDKIYTNKVKLTFISGIPLNEDIITNLKFMKQTLEIYFISQEGSIEHRDTHLMWIIKILPDLINLQKENIPEDTFHFLEIIIDITTYLKNRLIDKSHEEKLNWCEYSLYLLLKGYIQFLQNTTISGNDFPDLKKFYEFYSIFTKKTVIPIFVTAKDENIVIEPSSFPDEIHLKIFELLNIPVSNNNKAFILNYLGDTFLDNPLFIPLYAHEIGHLFDNSFMNIETTITNRLILESNDFFITLDKQNLQWIKEIIADSFAISLMGPAYLYSLINFINNEEALNASISHPSIAFRIQVMYTYLYQNDFLNLLTPQAHTELQCRLNYFKNNFSTSEKTFIEFEHILQNFISIIYKTIIDFLQNTGNYFTYDDITKLVCSYDGNLEKTRKSICSNSLTFKDLLYLQNINWLLKFTSV